MFLNQNAVNNGGAVVVDNLAFAATMQQPNPLPMGQLQYGQPLQYGLPGPQPYGGGDVKMVVPGTVMMPSTNGGYASTPYQQAVTVAPMNINNNGNYPQLPPQVPPPPPPPVTAAPYPSSSPLGI